ncbi:MAG: SDR family NAD(P)-dependent oxidoreductase [Acidobacteria bacterium]|nr:SDR family NAD(P)-dependent oxidoreductase [Acidobacteriota bacterium]
MEHCLVTGGTGFIGSNLVARLLAEGIHVIVADRNSPTKVLIPWPKTEELEFRETDLRDRDRIAELIRRERPDVVFHLAAQPLSARSNVDPVWSS